MLKEELTKRDLPDIMTMCNGNRVIPEIWTSRRTELIDILSKNIYGHTPAIPSNVIGEVIENHENAFANKVVQKKIMLSFNTPKGIFTFPFWIFSPKDVDKPPVFLHIAFRPDIPDKYTPIEEITDNGFAVVLFCYNDVTKDSLDGDFSQGLSGMYHDSSSLREPDEWGKIGVWAYAASRVLDFLIADGNVNAERIAVIGHSRLGKTALWAAAQDERFYMAVSNDSGFGGAALAKHGNGERVADFIRCGSWDWYCENFKSYLGNEDKNTVYDQHMLLAAIVPRHIYIGSAELDKSADPKSEFLSCYCTNEIYDMLGYTGLVTPDNYPKAPVAFHQGRLAYHIRKGTHFLSRTDWLYYMEYFKSIL